MQLVPQPETPPLLRVTQAMELADSISVPELTCVPQPDNANQRIFRAHVRF